MKPNDYRALLIEDARHLAEGLNIEWLKDRDLTTFATSTLESLTRALWSAARERAAEKVNSRN